MLAHVTSFQGKWGYLGFPMATCKPVEFRVQGVYAGYINETCALRTLSQTLYNVLSMSICDTSQMVLGAHARLWGRVEGFRAEVWGSRFEGFAWIPVGCTEAGP